MDASFLRAVDGILRDPAAAGRKVTHVAVSSGPGSFTGLRVGMAAAKGFCFGWGVPLVPVPTLHALAWRFRREGAAICPLQDARKGEFYSATFRFAGGSLARLSPDAALSPEALAERLPAEGPVLFCGDGVAPARSFLSARLGARAIFPPEGEELPSASAVGELALELLRAGVPLPDPASVVPTYVRASEAEVKRSTNAPPAP
jgi:tRNA threonylcarbamoyladenosine biosynthesis protein TsaB